MDQSLKKPPVANNGCLKGCDIASFDAYPINSIDPIVKNKLYVEAKGSNSLRAWSDGNKPVWTWTKTTLNDKYSPRKPIKQHSHPWFCLAKKNQPFRADGYHVK